MNVIRPIFKRRLRYTENSLDDIEATRRMLFTLPLSATAIARTTSLSFPDNSDHTFSYTYSDKYASNSSISSRKGRWRLRALCRTSAKTGS